MAVTLCVMEESWIISSLSSSYTSFSTLEISVHPTTPIEDGDGKVITRAVGMCNTLDV